MRIALPAAAFMLAATGALAQAPYSNEAPYQPQAPYQQGAPGQYDPQQSPPGGYQGAPPSGAQGQPYVGQPYAGQPYAGQPYAGQTQGGPPGSQPPGAPPPRGVAKFDAANVTHDGRLTRDQAAAGGLRAVARNFDAIDRDHKGYVTKQDLREWHRARRAAMNAPQGPGGGSGQGPGPGASMQGPPPQ